MQKRRKIPLLKEELVNLSVPTPGVPGHRIDAKPHDPCLVRGLELILHLTIEGQSDLD